MYGGGGESDQEAANRAKRQAQMQYAEQLGMQQQYQQDQAQQGQQGGNRNNRASPPRDLYQNQYQNQAPQPQGGGFAGLGNYENAMKNGKRAKQEAYARELQQQKLLDEQAQGAPSADLEAQRLADAMAGGGGGNSNGGYVPPAVEYTMGPLGVPVRRTLEVGNRGVQKNFNQSPSKQQQQMHQQQQQGNPQQQYEMQQQQWNQGQVADLPPGALGIPAPQMMMPQGIGIGGQGQGNYANNVMPHQAHVAQSYPNWHGPAGQHGRGGDNAAPMDLNARLLNQNEFNPYAPPVDPNLVQHPLVGDMGHNLHHQGGDVQDERDLMAKILSKKQQMVRTLNINMNMLISYLELWPVLYTVVIIFHI